MAAASPGGLPPPSCHLQQGGMARAAQGRSLTLLGGAGAVQVVTADLSFPVFLGGQEQAGILPSRAQLQPPKTQLQTWASRFTEWVAALLPRPHPQPRLQTQASLYSSGPEKALVPSSEPAPAAWLLPAVGTHCDLRAKLGLRPGAMHGSGRQTDSWVERWVPGGGQAANPTDWSGNVGCVFRACPWTSGGAFPPL